MEIDIDSAVAVADAQAALIPWDLSVRLGGVSYKVRPLTNADLIRIRNLGVVEKPQDAAAAIAGLFEGPAPDLANLGERQLEVLLVAIVQGFKEHVKKKSQTVPEAVDLQIRAGGAATPPATSPTRR